MFARTDMINRVAAALTGADLTTLQAVLADVGWHNGPEDPDGDPSDVRPLDRVQIAERITDGLGMPAQRRIRAQVAVTLADVTVTETGRTHDATCWQRHADCLASRVREQLGLGVG